MDKISRDYVNIDEGDTGNRIYVNQQVNIYESELPVGKSHKGKEKPSLKPPFRMNPSISAKENENLFEPMNESTPQQAGPSNSESSTAPASFSVEGEH